MLGGTRRRGRATPTKLAELPREPRIRLTAFHEQCAWQDALHRRHLELSGNGFEKRYVPQKVTYGPKLDGAGSA